MAREAHMSIRSAWQQVIQACYLDTESPIHRWQQVERDTSQIISKLNKLPVDSLHIKAAGTDLTLGLDRNRHWLGGGGNNIPSFEIFISPDCRRTSGYITFDLPLYRYGSEIRDIYLQFVNGRVIKSKASKGQNVLQRMIDTPNADMVGEFSLTDKRFSRINRFMAETLYDENFGGKYGNTHIALGASFHECYPHRSKSLTPLQWLSLGYNDSAIHTDIISTADRVVTATMADKSSKVIYSHGKFVL
jgi:aminopeptidase